MPRQTLKLTMLGLRSLHQRLGTSVIIVVGIGGVVAVLVALLAMAQGFESALRDTGRSDRGLVLRTGASDEVTSWISADEAAVISRHDGVETASPELFAVVDLMSRDTGKPAVAIVRGVTGRAFEMRPELTVVAGRRFEPGKNELITGVGATGSFTGLALGDEVRIRDATWTVVGHFRGAGAQDSEIWMDLPGAQAAFRRNGSVSSVRLDLVDAAAGATLARGIEADPRLQAALVPETEFYREQARGRAQLIESFAYLIAAIMALGAVIAGYSTMHTAVSARRTEIATLRALGFGRAPVVVSVLLEAMALAAAGGLLAGGLVYVLYDGYAASTLDSASMSQVAFEFAVTGELVLAGLAGALVLGLLGALAPAAGAARAGIATALRGE